MTFSRNLENTPECHVNQCWNKNKYTPYKWDKSYQVCGSERELCLPGASSSGSEDWFFMIDDSALECQVINSLCSWHWLHQDNFSLVPKHGYGPYLECSLRGLRYRTESVVLNKRQTQTPSVWLQGIDSTEKWNGNGVWKAWLPLCCNRFRLHILKWTGLHYAGMYSENTKEVFLVLLTVHYQAFVWENWVTTLMSLWHCKLCSSEHREKW